MARVRSMLARVGRLERIDAPTLSPFERDYGFLENLAQAWRTMMDAYTLAPLISGWRGCDSSCLAFCDPRYFASDKQRSA